MEDLIIVVVDYNSNWPLLYEQEKQRLIDAIATDLVQIQHVGSTSVPGLAAKPIIDIAATIQHFPPNTDLIRILEELGYMYQGELGIAGRHFFHRGMPRSHHLHLVEPNSEVWQKQLLFRDFLRAYPEAAQRYSNLKRELAVKYKCDRIAYVNAKAPLIAELLAAANQWKLLSSH